MAWRAECEVDLDAIASNVETLVRRAAPAEVMAIVKADGYGHGLLPSARAALRGGATWLGVALLSEAVALRVETVSAPLLAWLWAPDDPDLVDAVSFGVDVTASALWQLDAIVKATHATGTRARVQLKIDTGLGRNGATTLDWPALVAHAFALEQSGTIIVTGIWSHFANADAPSSPVSAGQLAVFSSAVDYARQVGLRPQVVHLANSAATLVSPEAHFNLVRPGIAVYGISPGGELGPPEDYGLIPAMTLRARLAGVKRVPAGSGVSYGHEYVTASETTLGLVPLGYADGIPRRAGGAGPVLAAGSIRTVAGRVCMDQFVLDLGDYPAEPGDEVVLFGRPDRGEPRAEDWARVAGTIGYEVVTRLGPRIPRTYIGEGA